MKKTLGILLAVMVYTSAFSQPELVKISLSPMGEVTLIAAQIQLTHAGGEIFNAENDAANIHLSEGFIGPDISQMLEVEDYTSLTGVRIFPNPVSENLHVDLPDDHIYEVYLHDLTGKEIFRSISDNNSLSIYMKKYKTGVYLLSIVDRLSKRFVTYKIQKVE